MNLIKDIDIQNLCNYLELNVSKSKYIRCINPDHEIDKTPSMNVYPLSNTVGCFGCGRHYNVIQLYSQIKEVSEEEARKKLTELYDKLKYTTTKPDIKLYLDEKMTNYKNKLNTVKYDLNDKVNKYFKSRNIPNAIKYLKGCGYNLGLDERDHICYVFDKLIIEVTETYPKYLNYGISEPITLGYYQDRPYMIVEGIVDGLTALEMNYNAIVLNGVTNAYKLNLKHDLEYIIALDRDIAGTGKFKTIEERLQGCKYTYFDRLYLSRVKDLNELSFIKQPIYETIELNSEFITLNIIDKLMDYKKSLLIAPTGKGKTTAIFSYALKNDKENVKYVITCPNKVQNTQNENTFEGVQAIVKGVKIDFDINVYSVVYDRVDEVTRSLNDRGYKVILIVDEAHNLVYSKDFRKRAIKKLLNAEIEADKSIRVTATADTIINDKYDYIGIIPNRTLNVKHTKILYLHGNRNNNLIDLVKSNMNNFDKTIVYADNKELQKIIHNKFNFDIMNSETDMESDVFKNIVKHETIKNNMITTSVLQAGANIKLHNEKVLFIFHCKSVNDLNYEKIIQAVSRVRTGIDTLIITIGTYKSSEIVSYAKCRAFLSAKVDKKLKETKKFVYILDEENNHASGEDYFDYVDDNIYKFNNAYDKHDKKHNLGAIDSLSIDYFEVEKLCMSNYNKQFYYDAATLLDKLNLKGEIIDYEASNVSEKGESKKLKGKENFELYKEILKDFDEFKLGLVLENISLFGNDYDLFDKKYSKYNKELLIIKKSISDIKYIKQLILDCNLVKDLEDIKYIIQNNELEYLYIQNDDKLSHFAFGKEYKIIRDTVKLKSRVSNKRINELSTKLNLDTKDVKKWLNRIYNIKNEKVTSLKKILKFGYL